MAHFAQTLNYRREIVHIAYFQGAQQAPSYHGHVGYYGLKPKAKATQAIIPSPPLNTQIVVI
jgi:hypothetical protein